MANEQPPAYSAGAQPQTVVIIQQPMSRCMRDYQTKQTLIPGILMVIVAAINLGACVFIWVTTLRFHAIIISAFIFYLVTGILAIVVSRQNMYGCSIAALIFTIISFNLSFSYIILTGLDMATTPYASAVQYDAVMMLCILIAFACDIAIMVFTSKVLCCGQQAASSGTVVHGPPAPKYIIP